MLKILPPAIVGNQAKAKCGEIFCHSSTEFTIFCTFCEMKSFVFDDFLLHLQNVHFENNLLKTETIHNDNIQCTDVNVKSESIVDPADQKYNTEYLWESNERPLDEEETYSGNDYEDEDGDEEDSYEEQPISVLKIQRVVEKTKKKRKVKLEEDSHDEDEENNQSSDEYMPMPNKVSSSAGADVKPVACELCGKHFRNIGHLKIHNSKVHCVQEKKKKDEDDNKEQHCEECNQLLPNRKSVDHHVMEEHGGFKCSLCDKRFKQRHQRKRHEQSHTAERIFTCNVEGCGKSFAEKYYLKRHIDVHTTDRNYVCDFEGCGKAFHTMRRLRAHQNIHTKPKNLVCDACGYTCRENETLRVHQRVHTGEKPYACEVCEKRFISSSALGEHMASHSTTRPHVCKVCNASFARQKALYHHSFLHSDIKKFKCKICGSAYKQASGLAGHMRKHREEGMMSMLPDRPSQLEDMTSQTDTAAVPITPAYPFITF